MPFREIATKLAATFPKGTSERFKRLDALDRLRAGTFYDHIRAPFTSEYDGQRYVPMQERRPSIIWNGAKLLTDQLSGLLWGDEQMPIVRTYDGEEPSEQDKAAEEGIQHLVEMLDLDAVMDEVTDCVSSGSGAVVLRAMDDKTLYVEIVPGRECEPVFDPKNPLKLTKHVQKYPTKGQILADQGYEIADEDLNANFWFKLEIDDKEETRYFPLRDDKYQMLGEMLNGVRISWEVDAERSGPHGWGMLPVIWAKAPKGDTRDGECLYGAIVDMLVEIDYDLSQVGRGFRYTADPMLYYQRGQLREGATPAGYNSGRGNASDSIAKAKTTIGPEKLIEGEAGGDAKLLEISGQGLAAMGEQIKMYREWGLEICGGMKSDADNTKGPESGRALEMLYQNLILVVKRWRVALGNKVFLPLVKMLLTGIEKGLIEVEGLEGVAPDTTMRLVWPTWMTPTGPDLLASAQAWQQLAGGSTTVPVPLLPRTTVTRLAAANLGMTDTSTIIDELEKQQTEDDAKAAEQADQEHQNAVDLVKAKPAPKPGAK